jgi:hypothetical protein
MHVRYKSVSWISKGDIDTYLMLDQSARHDMLKIETTPAEAEKRSCHVISYMTI